MDVCPPHRFATIRITGISNDPCGHGVGGLVDQHADEQQEGLDHPDGDAGADPVAGSTGVATIATITAAMRNQLGAR